MFKAKRNSLPSFGVRLGALLVLAASASIGLPLFGETAANIWYVDDDNYGKAEMNGKSLETAFGTIQEAIDAETTLSGDTIKVLPGTYNQNFYEETDKNGTAITRNRVYIYKQLNIVATESKEETHIVGKLDNGGAGADAIRCVRVASTGNGSTLTGFTIRDSATFKVETTSAYYCGGAVSVSATSGASQDFYVINCVISNAVTRRYGGAAYGGTFVGCEISNCKAYTGSAAFYLSHAVCSVVTGCDLTHGNYSTLESSSKFCNCTFYGNKDPQMKSSDYRNCLFLGQTKDETNSVGVIESNVYASKGKDYSTACPLQLVDPESGDFRPLKNSDVLGAGETRYLTTERIVDLPPGFVLKDYCGNDIDLSGERVAAGACLSPDTRKYDDPKQKTLFGIGAVKESLHAHGLRRKHDGDPMIIGNLLQHFQWDIGICNDLLILRDRNQMGDLKLRRLASHGIHPTLVFLGSTGYKVPPIGQITGIAKIRMRFGRRNDFGSLHMIILTATDHTVSLGKHLHHGGFACISRTRDKIYIFKIVL